MSPITVDWLTALLAKHDPEALICLGAPDDEYRHEAKRALPLLQKATSDADCLDVLVRVFDAAFASTHVPNKPVVATAWVMRNLTLAASEVWQRMNQKP